ncbi:hypothetical protein, partial [Burkholderia cepacia]|uniref:hypothetical protein n=1 Tax=Burkholderia cepacia TaxID=292 RepID=UPI002ABDD5D0
KAIEGSATCATLAARALPDRPPHPGRRTMATGSNNRVSTLRPWEGGVEPGEAAGKKRRGEGAFVHETAGRASGLQAIAIGEAAIWT